MVHGNNGFYICIDIIKVTAQFLIRHTTPEPATFKPIQVSCVKRGWIIM